MGPERLYIIEGDYLDDEPVPLEAIVGASKVDAAAEIVGDFIYNPNFRRGFQRLHCSIPIREQP